jgi:hypothetical protein
MVIIRVSGGDEVKAEVNDLVSGRELEFILE